MSSLLQPLAASNRETILDVLRGFALAGVLFIFCVSDIGAAPGNQNTLVDDIIAWPKYILIEGRMYMLLIILFGIGFHVQLKKAEEKGISILPAFSRRLIGLMLIGFVHAILLSKRDILIFYGIAGIFLMLLRHASNRSLLIIALVLFFIQIPSVRYLFPNPWPKISALEQPNNYPDQIRFNWEYFKLYHQVYFIYLEMLFHFLVGFLIGRTGLMQKLKANKKLRSDLLLITLAYALIFVPLFYFFFEDSIPSFYKTLNSWQQVLFSIGFRTLWELWMLASVTMFAMILIALSLKAKGRLNPLAAFGQMALSNYLIQSLILVPYLLVFDKYKDVSPSEGLVLFVAVFLLQLLFSSWWLSKFKMGPFEWLLRSITYWQWQSILKVSKEELRRLRLTTSAML